MNKHRERAISDYKSRHGEVSGVELDAVAFGFNRGSSHVESLRSVNTDMAVKTLIEAVRGAGTALDGQWSVS